MHIFIGLLGSGHKDRRLAHISHCFEKSSRVSSYNHGEFKRVLADTISRLR